MRNRIPAATAGFLAALIFQARPAEPSVEVIGKSHTIVAAQDIEGPGASVPGLANTYDMSIFEFNWGGRQSLFNNSGITTNSNFPLTNGEALTHNTHLGLSAPVSDKWKAGFLAELYGLAGDRTVGRVFGEELPWDNFDRENSAIQTSHLSAGLYNAFLESADGPWTWKITGGTLSPKDLPEFTRKEMNQVKLGSLVWRAPVTNASYFEKEDRKLEEGRHPVRGVDVLCDYQYREGKHAHLEIFTGATEPTPLFDLERDAYGGRAAADIGHGNLGLAYVYSDGRRVGSGIKENQAVWSLDSSYRLTDAVAPYFVFARTDYERSAHGESHSGRAWVGGLLWKYHKGYELKAQYQRVGENYDLMAYHKTEHYPSNFEGPNAQLTIPFTGDFKFKGTVYYLEQIDSAVTAGDTVFGDSFFPSLAGSGDGTIGVERLSADWKISKNFSVNGYLEYAKFRKHAPSADSDIDKDIFNFYGGATWNLTREISLEGSWRHFFSVGEWQAMAFRSYQDIPELAIGYKIGPDKRALLLYHYYDFKDHNGLSIGRNDYHGHQVIFEIRAPL